MKINIAASVANLKAMQNAIVYESSEDEGAMEHRSEIQSVIDALQAGKSDEEIMRVAEWVSLESNLVREGVK